MFHFVGHGGYDQVAEEGTLALADDAGRTDLVNADDLSRLLAKHNTLRLVVLNVIELGGLVGRAESYPTCRFV